MLSLNCSIYLSLEQLCAPLLRSKKGPSLSLFALSGILLRMPVTPAQLKSLQAHMAKDAPVMFDEVSHVYAASSGVVADARTGREICNVWDTSSPVPPLPPGIKSVEDWGKTVITFGRYKNKDMSYTDLLGSAEEKDKKYIMWILSRSASAEGQHKDLCNYLEHRCAVDTYGSASDVPIIPGTHKIREMCPGSDAEWHFEGHHEVQEVPKKVATMLPPGVPNLQKWGQTVMDFGQYKNSAVTYHDLLSASSEEERQYMSWIISRSKSATGQHKDLCNYVEACFEEMSLTLEAPIIPGTSQRRRFRE